MGIFPCMGMVNQSGILHFFLVFIFKNEQCASVSTFYPRSESIVHDKFSIFNNSNLYNFLAKIYIRSLHIMSWKKKKTWNVKTWSFFSWSAQSCSTSCNKAAAFRLKRMLQAFFNPQQPFCSTSGKVLRYVLDYYSSCSIFSVFFVFY